MRLDVFLFGEKVGELFEIKTQIFFKYDRDFLSKHIEISPLKLPTAIGENPYTNLNHIAYYNYLPGVFFDSLPDKFGTKTIQKYYEKKGISHRDLSTLQKLAFIGKNAIGALEYKPAVLDEESEEILEMQTLYEQTKNIILENIDDFTDDWLKHASSFASAGGARPKVLISWNKETNTIKNKDSKEQGFEEYLVKFDERVSQGDLYFGFTQLEYLYMSMAKEVGIEIPQIDLIYDNSLIHYAIKRFDRVDGKKLHLHTLSSMEHVDFNIPAHYSYLDALKLTDFLTEDFTQVKELFKRMVFNIIGRNQDDHAKNFSFIMDEKGKWRLSPAYDITYAYGSGYTKEHQLSINAKTTDIDREDIYAIADSISIPKKEAIQIVEEINDIFSEFKKRAIELGIDKEFAKEIEKNIKRL